MKRTAFLLAAGTMATALAGAGCADRRDVLFQTSTISALMDGAYDGDLTCGRLRRHGDFGLGTFDGLDGEMVVLDGRVWRVRADGAVRRAADGVKTPFAAVTFFDADRTASAEEPMSLQELTALIDGLLPTPNVPYAVRVRGSFQYVKTRSVPRQSRPYRRLAEVVKQQPTFEFLAARGTLVGFRLPAYAGAGLNVPGWHLHFLTADRAGGGHVLALVTGEVTIAIDDCSAWHVALPGTDAFRRASAGAAKADELKRIEK